MREFGTNVEATPWVEKDGSVRVQISAERARFVPATAKRPDEVVDDIQSSTVTVSFDGLFRVPPGKSVLLLGGQTVSTEGSGEVLLLVSAQVADTRPVANH
jgi:hypothetical protein